MPFCTTSWRAGVDPARSRIGVVRRRRGRRWPGAARRRSAARRGPARRAPPAPARRCRRCRRRAPGTPAAAAATAPRWRRTNFDGAIAERVVARQHRQAGAGGGGRPRRTARPRRSAAPAPCGAPSARCCRGRPRAGAAAAAGRAGRGDRGARSGRSPASASAAGCVRARHGRARPHRLRLADHARDLGAAARLVRRYGRRPVSSS